MTNGLRRKKAESWPIPMVHRFTLIKPGTKRGGAGGREEPQSEGSWNPLELFFSSTLLSAKCDVCAKRLGWKPVLECDDCGMK